MTRGRKPRAAAAEAPVAINEEAVRTDLAKADELTAGHRLVMQYEGAFRDLGRIDALEFLRRVGDVATAQIFENVRNSGSYKGMPYVNAAGLPRYIGSFEEFCQVKLGKSYNRCLELAQNLRALGPDLYEQSEAIGLRNVDYKALRALPADEQALVKRAVEEAKSKDEVVGLLQELAASHHREREAKDKEIAELSADGRAKDEALAAKNSQLDALDRQLRKRTDPWPAEIAGVKDEMNNLGSVLDECFAKHLTFVDALDALTANAEPGSEKWKAAKSCIHRLGEQVGRLCHLAAGLRFHYESRLADLIDEDLSHVLPADDEEGAAP